MKNKEFFLFRENLLKVLKSEKPISEKELINRLVDKEAEKNVHNSNANTSKRH
jgi:hypothetical protein